MIVVDSSVWIDYFRGVLTPQTDLLDRLLGQQVLAIGDLILMEVLQGFDRERDFANASRVLGALVPIEIGGIEVAVAAARNYRALRALEITVRKTVDTLIATRCLIDGHSLLFSDRDFEPFVTHLGLIPVLSGA